MAWPKLRNKSSGPPMTGSNRSGAAHDGTRSHGGAPQGASGGSARGPAEPVPDAPAVWPGQVEDGIAGVEFVPVEAVPVEAVPVEAVPVEAVPVEAVPVEAVPVEVAPAEPESADLALWDWSPYEESVPSDDLADEPVAQDEPPRSEWKAVVTPVEEVDGAKRTPPGIGQYRGNLAHLARHPRMRVWRLRIVVAVLILVAFSILVSWQFGRAGYRAMNGNVIPESQEQIDHLVVGPAGVFAIDSEAWDKHLVVRTKNARQLWHGPFSMKDRLEHAHWESQRAADLLSGAMGKPVAVRPAMAVYGPKIPWDVATIRDVDVFSGPRLRKYLRRRARQADARPLTDDEIERIYAAANKAFPHLSSGSPVS